MSDLFRAEQQQRLEEMRTEPEPSDEWPRGCRGSRRPWLVFIRPSPGGKAKLDEPASPIWNRPFTDPFHWGGGFKRSIRPLLSVLMPEANETEATFLYAVYQLGLGPRIARKPGSAGAYEKGCSRCGVAA